MLLEQRSEFLELYPGLGKIYRLYLAWVQPVPKIAQKDKSYRDPNDVLTADSDDEDRSYHDGHSNRTRSGRGDGFSLRPRTRGVAAGRDGEAVITLTVVMIVVPRTGSIPAQGKHQNERYFLFLNRLTTINLFSLRRLCLILISKLGKLPGQTTESTSGRRGRRGRRQKKKRHKPFSDFFSCSSHLIVKNFPFF